MVLRATSGRAVLGGRDTISKSIALPAAAEVFDRQAAADADERLTARYRLHAEICKVLTDPKRLRLLDGLRDRARTVGELASAAALSVPNTSQHLAVLRHAGLVETRRAGTSIHYRLIAPELIEACDAIDRIVRRRLG